MRESANVKFVKLSSSYSLSCLLVHSFVRSSCSSSVLLTNTIDYLTFLDELAVFLASMSSHFSAGFTSTSESPLARVA